LVAWNTICLPKSKGGLGIRDPKLLNKTMGAKTWWRWLQQKGELWSRLWKKKYAYQIDSFDLIRMIDTSTCSLIWNSTWKNQWLIQQHNFWEICNGKVTLFWEDSWQQIPSIQDDQHLIPLKSTLQDLLGKQVINYWAITSDSLEWCTWHIDHDHIPLQLRPNFNPYYNFNS
jgi:hypothetical protein